MKQPPRKRDIASKHQAPLALAIVAACAVLFPSAHAIADGSLATMGEADNSARRDGGELPNAAGQTPGSADVRKVMGTAIAAVEFKHAAARGNAQPHVALHYESTAPEGEAGLGWGLEMPSIQRKNLSGLPNYQRDPAGPNAETALQTLTDRFVFAGGPLVPLCTVGIGPNLCPGGEDLSHWTGWHYFRQQVDTLHARFFWSADHMTWRVQLPSGNVMEFGAPHENPMDNAACEFEDVVLPHVLPPFRWNLVREWDSIVSSGTRPNMVVYRWGIQNTSTLPVLTDVFDTPTQSLAFTLQSGEFVPDGFAHHLRLNYENVSTPLPQTASGLFAPRDVRLASLDVLSMPFSVSSGTSRGLVRRYHFGYHDNTLDATSTIRRSLLTSIQEEGTCDMPAPMPESQVLASNRRATLCSSSAPITTLDYTALQGFQYNITGHRFSLTDDANVVWAPAPYRSCTSYGCGSTNAIYPPSILGDVDRDGKMDVIVPLTETNYHAASRCSTWFSSTQGRVSWNFVFRNQVHSGGAGLPFSPTAGTGNEQAVTSSFASQVGGFGLVSMQLPCSLEASPGSDPFQWTSWVSGDWTGRGTFNYLLYAQEFIGANQWSHDWVPIATSPSGPQGGDAWFPKPSTQDSLAVTSNPIGPDSFQIDIDADGLADRLFNIDEPSVGTHHQRLSTRRADGAITPFVGDVLAPKADASLKFADLDGDGALDSYTVSGTAPSVVLIGARGNGRTVSSPVAITANLALTADTPSLPAGNTWQGNSSGACATAPYPISASDALANNCAGNVARLKTEDRLMLRDVNGDGLADAIHLQWAGFATGYVLEVLFGIGLKPNSNPPEVLFGSRWSVAVNTVTPYVKMMDPVLFDVGDMNGSGTPDIVLSDGVNVFYFDLLSDLHVQPFLLQTVGNGLGATTLYTYERTTDLPNAASVQPRSVVARLQTSTVLDGVVSDRDFFYANPVVDGWTHAFRGFKNVRERLGHGRTSADHPVQNHRHIESSYLIAEYNDGQSPTPQTEFDDDAMKTLPALEAATSIYGDSGSSLDATLPTTRVWLSTRVQHYAGPFEYAVSGIDGRHVRFIEPDVVDTYLYDSQPSSAQTTQTFTVVNGVVHSRTFPRVDGPPIFGSDMSMSIQISVSVGPSQGREHVRTTVQYDGYGNPQVFKNWGRVEPSPDGTMDGDPAIVQVNYGTSGSDWTWRPLSTLTAPFTHRAGVPDGLPQMTTRGYNTQGQLTDVYSFRDGSVPLDRRHEDPMKAYMSVPGMAWTQAPHSIWEQHVDYDATTGQPVVIQSAAAGSCTNLGYDSAYGQLLTSRVEMVGGCYGNPLFSSQTWNRERELVTTSTDEAGALTTRSYDAFGRLTDVFEPDPNPALPGMSSMSPAIHTDYFADGNYGWRVHQTTIDGGGTWSYADGVGRPLVELTLAANNQWVANGIPDLTLADHTITSYRPWFYTGDPSSFPLSAPGVRSVARTVNLDALGRPVQSKEFDDAASTMIAVGAKVYHGLSLDVQDRAQLAALRVSSVLFDGFGNVRETDRRDGVDTQIVKAQYQSTHEPARIVQSHAGGGDVIVRWMQYDTAGHMVVNAEPNTSTNFSADPSVPGTMHAWRYAYDDAGRLVGDSDARGCGINYYYDSMGRETAQDYSPCLDSQADYTFPNLWSGDGTESFSQYDYPTGSEPAVDFGGYWYTLQGRLASQSDRGSQTNFAYDGRGRGVRATRQVANPGSPAQLLANRYAPTWSTRYLQYTDGDQLSLASTGADVALLENYGNSEVSYSRDPRGALTTITSSYDNTDGIPAPLVQFGAPRADGLPTSITYGDLARTKTTFDNYDSRGRLTALTTRRSAPALWSGPTNGTYPSLPDSVAVKQLDLTKVALGYQATDDIGSITDSRDVTAWPPTAKPVVTTTFTNDALHRLSSVTYDSGNDSQGIPFKKEYINLGGIGGGSAISVPQADFSSRVKSQNFTYNWTNDITTSTSDLPNTGFYDRSLGSSTLGTPSLPNNQLTSSSAGAGQSLGAKYDGAGNLKDLWVDRTGESCATGGAPVANQRCSQRYIFDWDEVGNLSRARRWDYTTPPTNDPNYPQIPAATANQIDDAFIYSGHGRVIKSQSVHGDTPVYDVDIFDSLVLRGTTFAGDYTRNEATESIYLGGHARLLYLPGLPTPSGDNRHIFYELRDGITSVDTIVDRETSEVVERRSSQAYGQDESEYRPNRWGAFREDLRYTGKTDDVDIGLVYFGYRYYSPALMRWISADPLTIHGLGADINPYAYVRGNPANALDTCGLVDDWLGSSPNPDGPDDSMIGKTADGSDQQVNQFFADYWADNTSHGPQGLGVVETMCIESGICSDHTWHERDMGFEMPTGLESGMISAGDSLRGAMRLDFGPVGMAYRTLQGVRNSETLGWLLGGQQSIAGRRDHSDAIPEIAGIVTIAIPGGAEVKEGLAAEEEGVQSLLHYTDEAGHAGILESEALNPSLKALNPADARYGNGQYLSDIVPGTRTPAQLSRDFLGAPFWGSRFSHFVEIDVSGLNVVQGRPGVFVVPNEGPLLLAGRIVRSGKVP